ncbi:MAG: hypothetical protein B7X95_07495 [Methylophilaceae bacterium 17-44-8]|jgi:hypothetical protein|nr:MAG: hypothetical protein B7X95_07495 [Methylophilaceae bacterium 17-44-8]
MLIRSDKHSQKVVKAAVNLVIKKDFKSAARLMFTSGIAEITIERVLYEPYNVRSTDLDITLRCLITLI